MSIRQWISSCMQCRQSNTMRRRRAENATQVLENRLLLTAPFVSTAPYGADDYYSIGSDFQLQVDTGNGVLANDTSASGGSLYAQLYEYAEYGTIDLNSDGSFSYYPGEDFDDYDTFSYQVLDDFGYGNLATVEITLDGVLNSSPTAVDDLYSLGQGTYLQASVWNGLLANDSDPEGDHLTVQLESMPTDGSLVLDPDGSFEYISYGNQTQDSFTYRAYDGDVWSDTATVQIVAGNSNSSPQAFADNYETQGGQLDVSVGSGLIQNDVDADGDSLTVELVQDVSNGELYLSADGSFHYTSYASGSDSFVYHIFDGQSWSNNATVTISNGSSALEAVDDYHWVEEDSYDAFLSVMKNDSIPSSAWASVFPNVGPQNGSVWNSYDYSSGEEGIGISVTPGFVGVDSFSYQLDGDYDSDVAVVTLDVHQVDNTLANARPTHLSAGQSITTGGIIGDGPQSWSDVDLFAVELTAGDLLHIDLDAREVVGGESLSDLQSWLRVFDETGVELVSAGSSTDPNTGLPTLDPFVVLNAPDSGTYYIGVSDAGNTSYDPEVSGGGYSVYSGRYALHLTRDSSNSTPAAANDTATGHHGEAVLVDVLANDSDPDGNSLSISSISLATYGAAEIVEVGGQQYIQYTSNTEFTGQDSFSYVVADPGGLEASGIVMLTVTNSTPLAEIDEFEAVAGVTLLVDGQGVLENDSDADSDLLEAVLQTGPDHGTLSLSGEGSFTYTPAVGYFGTDSFTYSATDGADSSDVATVMLEVFADFVVAQEDSFSLGAGDTLVVTGGGVLGNDWSYEGETLSANVVSMPSHGTLNLQSDGTLTYVPTLGFTGVDSFSYVATSAHGSSEATIVTIAVTNFAPVAVEDVFTIQHNQTLQTASGALQANDYDHEDAALTVLLDSSVASGSLVLLPSGAFSYTAPVGFSGTEVFSYQVFDGTFYSAPVDVTIVVSNLAPVALGDKLQTPPGESIQFSKSDLIQNDYDAEGDNLVISLGVPEHGALVQTELDAWIYTPPAGFTGDDAVSYTISDGVSQSETAILTIRTGNQAPIAVNDYHNVAHGQVLTSTTSVLDNDVDNDNAQLTVTVLDLPNHGTLTMEADGAFEYTPAPGFAGEDEFTYVAHDGFEASGMATVYLSVRNHTPVALPDSFRLTHGSTITVAAPDGLLANDSDSDNDALTVQLVSSSLDGLLTLSDDGGFSYESQTGFVGSETVEYRLYDGVEYSVPQTVTFNVTNSAPLSSADRFVTSRGVSLNFDAEDGVLANDFDADHDLLTAEILVLPASGSLTFGVDGGFEYQPDPDFMGIDSFTYVASDGAETTAPVEVLIEVTNNAPFSVNRSYLTTHGSTLSVAGPGLFGFSSDREADLLSLENVGDPVNGILHVGTDGSFQYTPNLGFVGQDEFTYQLDDGLILSQPIRVSVNVTNDSPNPKHDTFDVPHGRVLNVTAANGLLANDEDLDGDPLLATLAVAPSHGSLQLAPDGAFSYIPNLGYTGIDTFEYSVSDGAEYATASVTLYVMNSAPDAHDDIYGTSPSVPLAITAADGVLHNDFDAEADALTAQLVRTTRHGSVDLLTDGSFLYTPQDGFVGVDDFLYRVSDSTGAQSEIVRVQLSSGLYAVNDRFQVSHDSVLDASFIANDLDTVGESLSIVVDSDATIGAVTVNADGTFQYSPPSDFIGQTSFRYQISNNSQSSGWAVVDVDVTNSAPRIYDASWTSSHSAEVAFSAVLGQGLASRTHDTDGDPLVYSVVVSPEFGTIEVAADGSFVYTPFDSSFTGVDSFDWKVTDGFAISNTGTAWLELTNETPVTTNDRYQVKLGETLNIGVDDGVLSNDFDFDGDSIIAELTVMPQSGVITLHPDGAFDYVADPSTDARHVSFEYRITDGITHSEASTVWITLENTLPEPLDAEFFATHDQSLSVDVDRGLLAGIVDVDGDLLSTTLVASPLHGSVVLQTDGAFVFQPAAGFIGDDQFSYTISDGYETSAIITVSLTVGNAAPIAAGDVLVVRRGQSLTFDISELLENDRDEDGDGFTFSGFTTPEQGSLQDNLNGTWTYTSPANFVGTDSFEYTLTDGFTQSDSGAISVEVTNAAPTARRDRIELPHGVTYSGDASELLGNDFDLDGDQLNVSLVSAPLYGTLILSPDGSFTYTPDSEFSGQDSFSYKLSDGYQQSQPVRVELEVQNSRPSTHNRLYQVGHSESLSISTADGLLETVLDLDGDALTLELVADVLSGDLTMASDGSWVYTPEAGFIGTDSFLYRVSDGQLSSSIAEVQIEVTNSPVVASLDSWTIAKNETLSIAAPGVLLNDSDVDGDSLSLTLLDETKFGSIVLLNDGSFTYTPIAGYAGRDTFTYRVSDGVNDATASVEFTVTGTDETTHPAPAAGNDYYTVNHSELLTVNAAGGLLANDFDSGSNSLSVALISGPSAGTLTLQVDGSFEYTPSDGGVSGLPFTGLDSFVYEVSNGTDSQTATAEIDVRNAVPWASNASFSVHQGAQIDVDSGSLVRNSGDQDGDPLSYSLVDNPQHGIVSISASGQFTYTPDAGYSGADSFTWSIVDSAGATKSAVASIDVTNDRPVATSLDFRVAHGQILAESERGLLSGATDRNNDSLTASLADSAANGTVVVNTDGSFIYSPHPGFSGTDYFTFYVSDGAEQSFASTVYVDVQNTKPVATNGSVLTPHGVAVEILVEAFDADADDLEFQIVEAPVHGTLSFDNLTNDGSNGEPLTFTGGVQWIPAVGFTGSDVVKYRAFDGVDFSDVAEVELSATNFRPTLVGSAQLIDVGSVLAIQSPGLFGTAADGDDDELTLEISEQPQFGEIELEIVDSKYTGGYLYTPDAGFSGEDTFEFRVFDGVEWSDSVRTSIFVGNTAPVLSAGTLRTAYGDADVRVDGRYYTFDLDAARLAVDADGHPLTFSVEEQPAVGVVTILPSGQLEYFVSEAAYSGTQTLSLSVSDGFASSGPVEIAVTVTNAAPVAVNDFMSVAHGGEITFTVDDLVQNDQDADGDLLHLVSISSPQDGTLTEANGVYTFTPNHFVGSVTLDYVISDGISESSSATLEVVSLNDTAWAVSPVLETDASGQATINLASHDGVANPDGDHLEVIIVEQPNSGSLAPQGDGSYQYVRHQGFTGSDTFTYQLSDGASTSEVITAFVEAMPLDLSFSEASGFGIDILSSIADFWVNPELLGFTYHDSSPIGVGESYVFDHGSMFNQSELNFPQPADNDIDPDGDHITGVTVTYDGEGEPGTTLASYNPFSNGDQGSEASYGVTITNHGIHSLVYPSTGDWGSQSFVLHYDLDSTRIYDTIGFFSDLELRNSTLTASHNVPNSTLTFPSLHPYKESFQLRTDPTGNSEIRGTINWTATEQYGISRSGIVNVAITQASVGDFRWDTVVAQADQGQWHGAPVVGNVLTNDHSPDNDDLTVTGSTMIQGADAGSITINPNGQYTAIVTDPEAFLAAGGMKAEYTVTDEQGNTTTAVVSIVLRLLQPGESVGANGISVTNGTKYDGSGTYENGVSPFSIYIDSQAHVLLAPGSTAKFDVDGGSAVISAPSVEQVWTSVEGDVSFSGSPDINHANISASGNVQGFSGKSARIQAGGDVGDVSADSVLLVSAGGNVGNISGVKIYHVSAGQNIGNVTATEYVNVVNATQSTGNVIAQEWVNTVTAGLNIAGVTAGGAIGFDGAGGTHSLGQIYAGQSILGDITAGGGITSVYAGQSILGNVTAGGSSNDHIFSVGAGDVTNMWLSQSLVIDHGTIDGNVSAGGNIGSVQAAMYLHGDVSAGNSGSIGEVAAGQDITGDVEAGAHIGSVRAGTDFQGKVIAEDGSIGHVLAGVSEIQGQNKGNIYSTEIKAGLNIGRVHAQDTVLGELAADGNITGDITAEGGELEEVIAHGSYTGNVKADGSIGRVTARRNITGNVEATTGGITEVASSGGSYSGDVKAGQSIQKVTAHVSVSGSVDSTGGEIKSVTAYLEDVNASVSAENNIGFVTAGRDVGASVTSRSGSITHVIAGLVSPGNISGTTISAHQNIGLVQAFDSDAIFDPNEDASALTDSSFRIVRNPDGSFERPARPEPIKTGQAGKISAAIDAGGRIGSVIADGSIEKQIAAVTSITKVSALGSILQGITSGLGSLQVFAGGSITGDVNSNGTNEVISFEGVHGNVTSTAGGVHVATFGESSGNLTGEKGVGALVYESINGVWSSPLGPLSAFTLADAILQKSFSNGSFSVTAFGKAYVEGIVDGFVEGAQSIIDGGQAVINAIGDVVTNITFRNPLDILRNKYTVYSFGNIDASSTGATEVKIVSWKNVKANVAATEDITIYALKDANLVKAISDSGNIFVEASNISGKALTLAPSSGLGGAFGRDGGSIILRALGSSESDTRVGGNVDIHADAAKRISVSAFGDISGSLKADQNIVAVAIENITATVNAGADVLESTILFAGDSVSGNVTAESEASVTAINDITGNITVQVATTGDAVTYVKRQKLTANAGGDISGNLKSDGDISVFSGKAFSGDATAVDDLAIQSGGTLTGELTAGAERSRDVQIPGDPDSIEVKELHVHIASIIAYDGVESDVSATHGIDLVSFGSVSGNLNSTQGPILVAAQVGISGESASSSDLSGTVDAGQHVSVQATGKVSSSRIVGRGDITVAAHEGITSQQILSKTGYVELSSDSDVNTSKVTAHWSLDVDAVGSVTGQLTSTNGSTTLWTGGSFTGSAKADKGLVIVEAIESITSSGIGLDGQLGVFATAYGNISGLDAKSTRGAVSIFSAGQVSTSTAEGLLDVSVVGLKGITGQGADDFSSASEGTSIFSLGEVSQVGAVGNGEISVIAAGAISDGKFHSSSAGVSVISTGTDPYADSSSSDSPSQSMSSLISADVSAIVTGRGELSVTALGGNVSGSATTTSRGNVSVTARGSSTATVTSAGDASVSAGTSVSGTASSSQAITASGNIDVVAFDSVQGQIDAGGRLNILAGTTFNGISAADLDVNLTTLAGEATGEIISRSGSIGLLIGGNLPATTTAKKDVNGFSLGDVSGEVEATEGSVDLVIFGSLTVPVTSGKATNLFVLDNVTSQITAGTSASVLSLGTIDSDISANQNISIWSSKTVSGSATAGLSVDLFAGPSSTATVSAGENAVVHVLGTVTGTTAADKHAIVWAGDTVTGGVTAGETAAVIAWGSHTGTVTSVSGSVLVFTDDGGDSTIFAEQDAVYISWADSSRVNVTATRDIGVISAGAIDGHLTAGQDVYVASLGNVVTPITAGRDLWVFTYEDAFLVQASAGRDAGVISGTNYNAGLTAGRDAFVYTFGTAVGSIVAEEYAGLVAWQAVAGPFVIDGNDGAYVASIESFNGQVTSQNGGVGAVVMGSFVGTLDAGADAWLIGEGTLLVGAITAVDDASVYLYGDVNGSVVAGGVADVFTYGDLTGTVTAGEDILGAYARGDINGLILSENGSIWSVLSHGSIDATISALGTGERVASVIAWGAINGTISAEQSVDVVRSANAITAVITPESTVVANDSTVITQFPIPDIPDSVLPELLSHRETILANWEADTTESRAQMQGISEEIDAAVEATYNALAEIEQELRSVKEEIESELDSARTETQIAFLQGLDELRSALLQHQKDLLAQVEGDRQTEIQSRNRKIEAGESAWESSLEEAQRAKAQLEEALSKLTVQAQETRLEFEKDADKAQDWTGQLVAAVNSFVNPAEQLKNAWKSVYADHQKVNELGDVLGLTGLNRAYFYVGNMFPGIRLIDAAYNGRDPWTLEKLSTFDRILSGVTGVLNVGLTVLGVGRVYNFFTAPCRTGWIFGKCFTGDTPVVIAELPHGSSVAFAGVQVIPDDEAASFGNLCLILGVGAGVLTLSSRRKKKATQRTGGRGSLPGTSHAPLEVPAEPDLTPELDELYGSPTSAMLDASVPAPSRVSSPPRQNPLVAEQPFSALSEHVTPASESTEVHEDVPVAAVQKATESGWEASGTIASEMIQEHQPVTTEPTTIRSGRSLSVVMGLLSIALICLGIFFKGQSTTGSAGPQLLAAATASADVQNSPWLPTDASSSPKYQTVPIRDIQAAGYRVLADNPETPGQAPSDYGEFDRETWRILQLQISKPDGGWLKVSLARPLSWIDEAPKNSDGSIWLEFEELGIANWAEVLSINECPEDILGDGRLVTGTFQHSAANVIELTFSHSEETIRSTANHPFWSEDRQEFVQAGELATGEHVRLLDGSTSSLARAVPLEEEFPVFNLEVDGEHVYYVGQDGILVHNARSYNPNKMGRVGEHVAIDAIKARGWKYIGTVTRGRNGIDLVFQKKIRGKLKTLIVESKVNSSRLSKLQKLGPIGYAKNVLDRFRKSSLSPSSEKTRRIVQKALKEKTLYGVVVRTDWRANVFKVIISLWLKK